MNSIPYPCTKCKKNVKHDCIECSLCLKWTHRQCAGISKKILLELGKDDSYWYCNKCKDLFPFQQVLDDEFLFLTSNLDVSENILQMYKECNHLSYVSSVYTRTKNETRKTPGKQWE